MKEENMAHIPEKPIIDAETLSFEAAMKAPQNGEFDPQKWLYVPPFYEEYRYILGTAGERPLLCVGLNPSTAKPNELDNTLKSVERIARHNGFDSFLMMNLYAQRATRPGDMDKGISDFLHRENLNAFRYLLEKTQVVWAAWGAVMETRGYLSGCIRDFALIAKEAGAKWHTAGKRSIKGHPHHPLYLKKDSKLDSFDIESYLLLLDEKQGH